MGALKTVCLNREKPRSSAPPPSGTGPPVSMGSISTITFTRTAADYDLAGYTNNIRAEDTLYDIGDPARLRNLDKIYYVDWYAVSIFPSGSAPNPGLPRRPFPLKLPMIPPWPKTLSFRFNGPPTWTSAGFRFALTARRFPPADRSSWIAKPTTRAGMPTQITSLRKGVNILEVTAQPVENRSGQVSLETGSNGDTIYSLTE